MEYLLFKFKRMLVVPQGEVAYHLVIAEDRASAWRGVAKDISADSLLNTESLEIVEVSKYKE